MSADTSILPSELVVNPQPLIGFSGLDITKSTIHRTVWDAFNNNRKNDRAQIQFKLLSSNYEFPVSKPKRQSYEWYHPKGILKRNWMLKHLHVLPAVIVLFQDIEWNDPQWTEKQLQCAALVQSLKNSLQGRNTKLAIVLLQKNAPLPPGDDLLSVERAANLTSKCDINAKMLFVLPHNDHLMGYTLRLESAFLELAQTYYTQMGKKVRLHRDQLTSSHQTLQIRHLFKLGFISEMKFDYNTALTNYSNAYGNMDEIRIIDANCLEMKTVAGYLNYKMCKMMFRLNAPRDSITQFKSHIEKYRSRSGFKELAFEHYAWLSIQYSAFAELFCDAIKHGLPALQNQHPGIYYHKAAEYIGKRKEAFLECCALSLSPVEQNPQLYNNVFYSDFFGMRGTKLSEPISEQQIIEIIQQKEKTFDHSKAIISLLGHAMAQFKIYNCLRFRKKLAVDMAEEYLKSGDHSKALTLYSLMLTDYRIDKWYTIFTEVLLKTLHSAFLSASVADFISCSIEAMSPNIIVDTPKRIVILENLWKVFQNVPPISQSQIAPELKTLWDNALANFKSPIVIDLDKVSDLLESTLTFVQPHVKHDEMVHLELYVRSKADAPLKLQEFSVVLSDSNLHFKLIARQYVEIHTKFAVDREKFSESDKIDLGAEFMLQPNKTYKILFRAEQYEFTENSELTIVRLQITMGTNRQFALLTQSTTLNHSKIFKNYNPHVDCMENINIHSSCYIAPTFHLTTTNQFKNQPMLVNEYYRAECIITNAFDVALHNVGISITVPQGLRSKVFLTSDLTKQRQKLHSQIQIDLGDLQMQSATTVIYYVTSLIEGNIELQQKLWYQMDQNQLTNLSRNVERNVIVVESSPQHHKPVPTAAPATNQKTSGHSKTHSMSIDYLDSGVLKVKDDIVIVSCVEEFRFHCNFYALNRTLLTQAYQNEDFLLRVCIDIKATCNIDILDMFFICDHNITEKLYSKQRKKPGIPYTKGDKIRDVKLIRAANLTAHWTRQTDFIAAAKQPPTLFNRKKSTDKIIDYHLHPIYGSGAAAAAAAAGVGNLKKDDKFKNNLLSKIPINSTIIGSTNMINSNQLTHFSRPGVIGEDVKGKVKDGLMVNSFSETTEGSGQPAGIATNSIVVKNIFNKALDAFYLTDHCKGFLKSLPISQYQSATPPPISDFGVYCVRWRRSDSSEENESKFIISGIEIIEPPLNIYCYIDDRMYVKVPMTLKITLKNPTRTTLRLKTCLRTSENFIFAGNTQLNISIYSHSSYDLSFNLYPLKAGWQDLPEFDLKYNTQESNEQLSDAQNLELQALVNRWMPKRVFILPMLRNNN